MIDLGRITQGERGTLTFTWEFPDNLTSPATVLAATITATMRNLDTGAVTAVTGTLTGTAATTVTWALSAEDSGTAGAFAVTFRAVVAGVATYTLEAHLAIADNPAVDTVAAGALVRIPADDAAWAAAGRATVPDGTDLVSQDDLGTAAAADTTDFDAAGSAATVQGNLNTHTGMTGTAVHGLGSASTLTAGAVGSALVATATQDAARAVLGLAPIPLEPRRLDHSALTYTDALTGSGTAKAAANACLNMDSGTTANSTARRYANINRLFLGATSNNSINWAVKNIFRCRFSLGVSNAEGIFRWLVGKSAWSSYGIGNAEYMVGFELANGTLTYALYGNNTVPTQLAVSGTGNNITIISENGAVSWYADGVLVAQIGSGGPTGDRIGTINYEIENGATAADYQVRIWSQSECL